MRNNGIASRLWSGGRRVIEESRRAYAEDSSLLLRHASTLYCFRALSGAESELIKLRKELALAAARLRRNVMLDAKVRSEQACTLATILEWLSRSGKLTSLEKIDARRAAVVACRTGLKAISMSYGRKGIHLWCLLKLTEYVLRESKNDVQSAGFDLAPIARRAGEIADPKQRARVYRKLGECYRRQGSVIRGISYGARAFTMLGIPSAARKKCFSALLGMSD